MTNYRQLIKKDHWVFPYLKKYSGLLSLVIFLGFLTVFCGGALMFTSGYLISRSAQRPENILMIYAPIVLTRAFGIGRPSFRYLERLVSHNWVLRIVSNFRKRLYQIVERGTKSIHAKVQTGQVFNVLANDLFKIENFYLQMLFPTIIGWLIYLAGSIAVGLFSPITAILLLIVLGLNTILLPLITIAIKGASDFKQKQLEEQIYTELTDAVLGLQDWVLSGRTDELLEKQNKDFARLNALQEKDNHFDWWRGCVAEVIIAITAIILIVFANTMFGGNEDTVSWIAAFGLVMFPLADSLVSISAGFGEWPRYADSIQRLNELEEQSSQEAHYEQAPLPIDTTINFQNTSFSYDDKHTVLENINVTIKPGEHLAILGPSGAGKSTLLKLIMGDEAPTSGEVLIGGNATTSYQENRSNLIAVLDQQPYLFATSVANNLRLGNLHATEEQLWAVLAQVKLDKLVASLPAKLETPMNEAGKRFSGGERQRFALARILLQDTPIVILDEPTVGLDPITELAVLEMIFETLADKTIVWVTHHLTGIEMTDEVIFIDDHQISLQGTPSELIKTEPRFAQLLALDHGELI
ncbi:thiol reductant ABC exporter subunit CydC [Weissella tructae]|uniref:Thiol reductant ABC exporter, CydC subunit n=2 Tax=Weissella TaxID=46255 RepID=A0A075TUG3_9LACO|nr:MULTISPECIES: thiol reductant ABC exporter subunit CydC [Weissella]AIG65194.1 Thiol reductant ABC exporter, CydC subunit [Weissella tructae]AIM62507.1 Thiol reductant ABC exporter, CydC subunit [Weissella ceti]AIM63843.1 Thiol reductant ABC exporter, CydC subunit [Weissella ceti]ELA07596.1 cytochrome bd biosynthesis ABC-type transporter, ATPase and permease component [Weissella ceti NC36]QVV91577.1 thiol reductant ABC exporter subunit CydC [Weissella tructae]